MKQILMDLKGETESSAIIEENFNTPFTSMDRSSRQKINKETLSLKDTLGTSLVVQQLRLHVSNAGDTVQSLVGELRSHIPHATWHSQKLKKEKKGHIKPDKLNGYIQNISPQNSTICILLKHTWNILQNRSHFGVTEQISINSRGLKSYQHPLQPQWYKTRNQSQEKNGEKKHKNVEIKQHATE